MTKEYIGADAERVDRIIRRQAGEIEQLKTSCKGWYDQNTTLIQQRDKVQEENNDLRAEIRRLSHYLQQNGLSQILEEPNRFTVPKARDPKP